jgi:hypothetical protein
MRRLCDNFRPEKCFQKAALNNVKKEIQEATPMACKKKNGLYLKLLVGEGTQVTPTQGQNPRPSP